MEISRGRSRTAATSKMVHFVIIVNGWKPLTIITKSSILDVAAVLDPSLISKEQKNFGSKIDNKLNSKSHISELYKKASQKVTALSRLSSYLNNSEKKLIFNSIIKSQFRYCPLVWMLCSRTSNNND